MSASVVEVSRLASRRGEDEAMAAFEVVVRVRDAFGNPTDPSAHGREGLSAALLGADGGDPKQVCVRRSDESFDVMRLTVEIPRASLQHASLGIKNPKKHSLVSDGAARLRVVSGGELAACLQQPPSGWRWGWACWPQGGALDALTAAWVEELFLDGFANGANPFFFSCRVVRVEAFADDKLAFRNGFNSFLNRVPRNPPAMTPSAARSAVLARLDEHVHKHGYFFLNSQGASVRVVAAWHGFSTADGVEGVRLGGLRDLRTRDGGFFGAGIYAALQSSYGGFYADVLPSITTGGGELLSDVRVVALCYGAMGCAYPLTREGDYGAPLDPRGTSNFFGLRTGVALMGGGFDSHVTTVSPRWGYQAAPEGEITGGGG
jgi:hypothetical protein